jgi:glucan phosphoethanolaminetransferase (alkaline phosphatase superfamily)
LKKIFLSIGFYFFIFLYLNKYQNVNEVNSFIFQGSYDKAIIYFFVFLLSVLSIFILINIRNKLIKYFFYFILFITIAIDLTYYQITPLGFRYEDALNIIQLLNSFVAIEAGGTYIDFFIYASIKAIVVIVILFIINNFLVNYKFKSKWLILPMLCSFLVYGVITKSTANKLDYPSPYKIGVLLFYAKVNALYIGNREEVNVSLNKDNFFKDIKHIIFIADESIRGDKLEINGFDKNITPYLFSIKNKIINYGIASSGAVCSNYSETILLSGIPLSKIPDKSSYSRKIPTIFDYAKNAGFKTNLIDILLNKKNNRHFLMERDFDNIDNTINLSEKYSHLKMLYYDNKAIDELKILLTHSSKSFTYIVKYGCHFHYEDAYPSNRKIFKPTQSKAKWNTDNKEEFLNSYYNAINWSVDEFFRKLYQNFKGTDTLIIYTSDHGQNLMDDLSINQTHCAKGKAPKEMAIVPLFLLPMSDKIKEVIENEYKNKNYNHTSHFNIFGTILSLMGYDNRQINQMYGLTLFDDLSNQKRVYTSGDIFGRSILYKNKFDK